MGLADRLLDELRRIDLVLFYHVQKSRLERRHQTRDEFRGLYISEEEIDELFRGVIDHGPATDDAAAAIESSLSRISDAIARFDRQRKGAPPGACGEDDPLGRLVQAFGLDELEREILLLALAPELHLKYERIFAYLHDNVTKKRPTVDLLLALTSDGYAERITRRRVFSHAGRLSSHYLLDIYDEPGSHHTPLMAKSVGVSEGIVSFLLGEDGPCERLAPYVEIVHPASTIESLAVDLDARRMIAGLAGVWRGSSAGAVALFVGPAGTGKRAAADALCASAQIGLLCVDGVGLLASDEDPAIFIGILLREARLRNAAVYWSGADALCATGERAESWKRTLLRRGRSSECPLILAGTAATGDMLSSEDAPIVRIDFGIPRYELRHRIWEDALREVHAAVDRSTLCALAGRFRLSGGQIRRIVAAAKATSRAKVGDGPISPDTLLEACRAFSRSRLINLAVKVEPRRSWADLILPPDRLEVLQEISRYVKHQALVFEEWGFGRKLALSNGLNVLFAGPSGTGKSMGAEVLAVDLGLDLYRIDLATVVSKYVGETEKNLDRIFVEAEHSNAILFFDEADAIFGKRSEIRDSHDRYANIEISYLLQKMEAYDGIAILATNLRKNLDEAFLRRMHFTVEFPMPDEDDRLRIWRLCFPPGAPLADDVDFAFLARQFKLSGGNIKNIAVAAAFHAADHGTPITMESIVHGIRREFQKIGKLMVDADFPGFENLLEVKGGQR